MAIILSFLVGSYARDIYLYGNRTFPSIKPDYVQPVKQYAATTYSYEAVDNALARGWITESEHADTTSLMPPRPVPPAPVPQPESPIVTEPEPPVVIPPTAGSDEPSSEEAM